MERKLHCTLGTCRSQWPRGLRRRSTAVRLLRLCVRIPPTAWKFVCCECCVLPGRGLCDELITRPEESYRPWSVVVCDLETSWMRRPWPIEGCRTKNKTKTLCTCELDRNNFEMKPINMIQRDEHKVEVHGKRSLCGAGFQYTSPALVDSSTLSLNSTDCTKTYLWRNNMRCHLLCQKSSRLIQVITPPDNKE